jgi:hypothetical protein
LGVYITVPYFSGLLGGEIPEKLYEGDSAQIILQFPYEPPFASRGSAFGSYGFSFDKTGLNWGMFGIDVYAMHGISEVMPSS